MNKKQKTVTVIALGVFWVSCLFAPWELTEGLSHMDAIKYSPVFKAPSGGTWQKRRPSPNLAYTWAVLLVSYGMVVLVLSESKRNESPHQ